MLTPHQITPVRPLFIPRAEIGPNIYDPAECRPDLAIMLNHSPGYLT